MIAHPDFKKLRQWYDGRLSAEESREIEAHLAATCEICDRLLDDLAEGRENPPDGAQGQGSNTPAAPALPVLPGYEVREVIGRGGMGIVYKALHLGLRRTVALKM